MTTRRGFFATALGGFLGAVGIKLAKPTGLQALVMPMRHGKSALTAGMLEQALKDAIMRGHWTWWIPNEEFRRLEHYYGGSQW